ncbi:membrane protein [Streptomyces sp. AcH 505]|uniref:hypothetical protein n=1 Tax=unclassified Streptomyces TaxID=2593676 RepID=UPI000591F3AA|nr:hypothetical protein [Streptomyces sp. NBC_00370]KIF68411.1 membrane protein [Streptomyces sp. AcH 505]
MSFGQGGPQWGGPGAPGQRPYGSQDRNTPDWAALADASAARARRKRWLLAGGGVLATAAIAAIVATAVVSTSNGSDAHASNASETAATTLPPDSALPGGGDEPEPSFSSVAPQAPPTPKDFIDSADKDKAPLSAETLFPGAKLTMPGNHVYLKAATARTTNCAAAAQGALGSILASNSCDQVIRATYHKGGVAVTVGVAVFNKEAQALKAKSEARDGIASLSGAGVPTYCRAGAVCRKTTNSYGRYVYFTVSGFTNRKNVTKADKDVFAISDDLAQFTFQQIVQRGEMQASAAATAPIS